MSRAMLVPTLVLSALLAGCSTSGRNVPRNDSTPLVNTVCPVMTNQPADPDYTVVYKGRKIGMCCETCIEMWDEMTDEERDAKLTAVGISIS